MTQRANLGNYFVACVVILCLPQPFIASRAVAGADSPERQQAHLRSFSIEFQCDKRAADGTGELTYKMSIQYQSPHRVRSTLDLGDDGNLVQVYDRRFLWFWNADQRKYLRIDMRKVLKEVGEDQLGNVLSDPAGPPSGFTFSGGLLTLFSPESRLVERQLFGAQLRSFRVRKAGAEMLDGTATVVFQATNRPHATVKYRLWFAEADGLLRRQVLHLPDGISAVWRATAVKVNPAFKPSLFTVISAKGAEVIDMTESAVRYSRRYDYKCGR